MGPLKLEFYLTTLSMPEMILEVYVTEIMAYFVMVSLNFLSNVDLVTYWYSFGLMSDLLFDISAAAELRLDSSGGEVDSLALGKFIEVMAVIGDQHH